MSAIYTPIVNGFAPSFISYVWNNTSSTPIGLLSSSWFSVSAQSADNALATMWSGNTFTVPITGMYTFTWYGRQTNGSGVVEIYVYTTSTTNQFGPSGYQVAHQTGYAATCSFRARMIKGETFVCNGNGPGPFVGPATDHTLSILLEQRG
jgi:hypothetical protein